MKLLYQSSVRDFSFYIDKKLSCGDVVDHIYSVDAQLIKRVKIFDNYDNESSRRALGVEVVIQSSEKTLSEIEINNLSNRITLLRWTILFAAFGFLFNMLTVFALYMDELLLARIIFGSCCLSMIISIVFFIREIHISTNALKLHMSDMDVNVD